MEQLATFLSVRELDILQWASDGLTNKEIGKELHIAEETVKTRFKLIFAKLDAKNRTHAIAIALREGYIQ